MFKYLLMLLSTFTFSFAYGEIDKTEYTVDEKLEKIGNLNWQNNLDSPIIDDPDANAYLDLRGFHTYLTLQTKMKHYNLSTG